MGYAGGLGTKSSGKKRKSTQKCVNSVAPALNCFHIKRGLERAGTGTSKPTLNRLPVVSSIFAHFPPKTLNFGKSTDGLLDCFLVCFGFSMLSA